VIDEEIRRFDDYLLSVRPEARDELECALATLDEMAATVSVDEPWTAVDAQAWDRMTFETWIDARPTSETKRFLRTLTSAVVAAEAWDISLLHWLWYVASAGGLEPIMTTEGGAQDSRVVGGSQALSIGLAKRLGDLVRLAAPVREVAESESGVVTLADGERIESDRVIVAVRSGSWRVHLSRSGR
jgi:monoamine oxidase